MHAHLLQFCISALALHLWHSLNISSIVACNETAIFLLHLELVKKTLTDLSKPTCGKTLKITLRILTSLQHSVWIYTIHCSILPSFKKKTQINNSIPKHWSDGCLSKGSCYTDFSSLFLTFPLVYVQRVAAKRCASNSTIYLFYLGDILCQISQKSLLGLPILALLIHLVVLEKLCFKWRLGLLFKYATITYPAY